MLPGRPDDPKRWVVPIFRHHTSGPLSSPSMAGKLRQPLKTRRYFASTTATGAWRVSQRSIRFSTTPYNGRKNNILINNL